MSECVATEVNFWTSLLWIKGVKVWLVQFIQPLLDDVTTLSNFKKPSSDGHLKVAMNYLA